MAVVRRAAFDIGSGATKLVIADVAGSAVSQELFGLEVPVAFAAVWKQSADGALSEEIQAKGLEVLRSLLAECDGRSVPPAARCAIATEVFRRAANGPAYLERVRCELGLPVRVLTQEEEAEVGFKTAVALQEGPAEAVVCWDSGGASFQISARGPDGNLSSYLGMFGTGNTTALLVEDVQGRKFAEHPSPNPVSAEDAATLVERLRQGLPEPPDWLRASRVVAIGGPNSMFCVASEALNSRRYSVPDIRRAMDSVVGLSDAELALRSFCQGDLKEPPAFIVPKMCLLLAVTEHCGIEEVNFCSAIGSCHGLLIIEEMYAAAP